MNDKKRLKQLLDAVLITSYTPCPAPKNYSVIVKTDKEIKQLILKHQGLRSDVYSYIKRCERNSSQIELIDFNAIERSVEYLNTLTFYIKKCINVKYAFVNNTLVRRVNNETDIISNIQTLLSFPTPVCIWIR